MVEQKISWPDMAIGAGVAAGVLYLADYLDKRLDSRVSAIADLIRVEVERDGVKWTRKLAEGKFVKVVSHKGKGATFLFEDKPQGDPNIDDWTDLVVSINLIYPSITMFAKGTNIKRVYYGVTKIFDYPTEGKFKTQELNLGGI